jgi:hypothetical protein
VHLIANLGERQMKWFMAMSLAGGAVLLSACGGSSPTGESDGAATDNGKCNKGEYKGAQGEVYVCGKGSTDDECVDIDELAGFTSFSADFSVFPEQDADLSPLACLQKVSLLSVSDGKAIKDLTGLGGITSASAIEVLSNAKLTSLNGLGKIKSTQQLSIRGNPLLEEISGVPDNLTVQRLYVENNLELASIDGFSGLTITQSINFNNNPKLSVCEIKKLAARFPDKELIQKGNLEETCE